MAITHSEQPREEAADRERVARLAQLLKERGGEMEAPRRMWFRAPLFAFVLLLTLAVFAFFAFGANMLGTGIGAVGWLVVVAHLLIAVVIVAKVILGPPPSDENR